jgi:hypothetical protein
MVEGNGSTTHKEELSPKTFVKGDLVVYPNHGAGTVFGIEEKTILGEERRYYIVYVPDGGLTLNIPADGDTGLRSCADDEEVAEALEASAQRDGTSTEKLVERVRKAGRLEALRDDLAARKAVDLLVESARPIPVEQAAAREKLWTADKEREEEASQIWTPGSPR